MEKLKREKILSISFNQDKGSFSCGTELGIGEYNTDPYKGTFKRSFGGGIG